MVGIASDFDKNSTSAKVVFVRYLLACSVVTLY